MKLTSLAVLSCFALALVLTVRPVYAAPPADTPGASATADAPGQNKDDVKDSKDKKDRSKKNPNDGKDNNPNDGNAGKGNDNKGK